MFGNEKLDGFTYKGVTYSFMLDHEDDNVKTLHAAILADGTDIQFDWSPYSNPTQQQFERWVDLGCPERLGTGPINEQDLNAYELAVRQLTLFNVAPFGEYDYYPSKRDFTRSEITVMQCRRKADTQAELEAIEAAIPRTYTRKEQEEIDRRKVDGI